MTSHRRSGSAVVAGLLLVWAASWSAPLGRITWDTKYDLLIDPVGLLGRAMHMWDPQVTWGGVANQGYGYLFPMGPFFAVVSELAPAWVVQRLWWTALLTLGFWGALGLLRALDVATDKVRVVGALAWVLAPKVVSSVAVLSAEVQPQILAPLVMWPVVLAWRGRLRAGEAAVLSGAGILLCGGVNGTATLLALAPTGLFLVSRRKWWRARLTWAWGGAAVAATAWWMGPLVLMGRYAPPFLEWIETSRVVGQPLTLLEVVRGTTHWLGHLLTPGGPWWPAGYELATRPLLIVATAAVSALGLAGLSLRSVPLRDFCWLSLGLGVLVLSVTHAGPFASPLIEEAQGAFDGALAPLRNIHKADALVRLPMVIGLTHAVGVLARGRARPLAGAASWLPRVATGVAAAVVVAAGAPAFTGGVVARGGHDAVPAHWREVGRWLEANEASGSALVVPAANFGEYRWGRTIDEPLRSVTEASYAVRDAVPLAPAGTIRLLDDVERRLQSGRSLGGLTDVLRRSGVRHLVLRNDLSPAESGQPPVALARSALRNSPDLTFVEGFGTTFQDLTGERVFPVEVYRVEGPVADPVTIWDASEMVSASGTSDDLSRLADAGLSGRAVIFDGDRTDAVIPGVSVATDGLRVRNRFFGAPRGEDLTQTLTSDQGTSARDYLSEGEEPGRTTVQYADVVDIRASSSLADTLTFAGLQPSARPFAALDADPDTAWLTMWDPEPTLAVDLADPVALDHVIVTRAEERGALEASFAQATKVVVVTDAERTEAVLGDGPTRIPLGGHETRGLEVRVVGTSTESPETTVTGLAEIEIPGVEPREVIALPERPAGALASTIVLGSGLRGRDGCVSDRLGLYCLGGQLTEPEARGPVTHLVPDLPVGSWTLSGVLVPLPTAETELAGSGDVTVSASSSRTVVRLAQADAVVDGDPRTAWSPGLGDQSPSLRFTFARDMTLETVRLQTRGTVAVRAAPVVRVSIGGQQYTRRLDASGAVTIPATAGSVLEVELLPVPGDDAPPLAALEIEEVRIGGVDLSAPTDRVEAGCGEGPEVTVNGQTIPTRATATRDGWLGLAPVTWQGCDDHLGTGSPAVVAVGAWNGFGPSQTVLERVGFDPQDPGTQTAAWSADDRGARLTIEVEKKDEARVLVLTQNANDGWRARLGGTELASQVVDGRRQAFVLPHGASGTVVVDFAPNALYRTLLAVGLVTGVLLAGAAGVALSRVRRRRVRTGGSTPLSAPWPRAVQVIGCLAASGVVAGGAGVLAASLGTLIGTRLGTVARAAGAASLIMASGLAQAVVSPGAPGPAWLEGTIRLVLLLALAIALSAATPPSQSRRDP